MRNLIVLMIFSILTINCQAQEIDKLKEENEKIDSTLVLAGDSQHSKESQVIYNLLERYHFSKVNVNDSVSAVIYDNYITTLDNNKLYFLQNDIDKFKQDRENIDDYLKAGNLDFAYNVFNTFKQRVYERTDYAVKALTKGFDFNGNDEFQFEREDLPWAKDKNELDQLWDQRLKNDVITFLLRDEKAEKAYETLIKRYRNFHKTILQYKSEDLFQLYMNAFTEAADPHTSYFSPITSDNFKITMSLSLEGIGAQLTSKNDYTTVSKIIPGGPAFKDGRLKEEDRIVAVAQGEDGEMIDVVGWRLDDVVQLIRGKKGTLVRLSVLKANEPLDAKPVLIKIIREKVKLENQAAKKEIIEITENGTTGKIGVIIIPGFYSDFDGKNRGDAEYKSTTRDVRKLLEELNAEGVDGVIIDLRNNGGGSLDEAIELTGLFIKDGPVVQVKQISGNVDLGNDPDPEIIYSGPLAVIVNRFSASASEIFSAAIQDYGRGIILGDQSYGKGTVQNLLPLERFIRAGNQKLGQLKITIAKFYRITGSSTQHRGVLPDIQFPSAFPADEYGESSKPSALPWDQIKSTPFTKYADISGLIEKLKKKHEKRIENNIEFKYLMEDINEMKEARSKNSLSLNLEERKDENAKSEAKRKAREEARQKASGLTVKDKAEVPDTDRENDDPILEESGHILMNFIALIES